MNARFYRVQSGDTPVEIAIRFTGCPKCTRDLVLANPQKQYVVLPNGFLTFADLHVGEELRLPNKWFDGTNILEDKSAWPWPPGWDEHWNDPPMPTPHTSLGYLSGTCVGLGWCPYDPEDCVKIVKDAIDIVVNETKALIKEIKDLPDDFTKLLPEAINILRDVVDVIGSATDPQKAWEKFKHLVKDVGNFVFDVWAAYETIATLDLPAGFILARLVGMWPPQPNPRELAKVTFDAIESGDLKTAKTQLEAHAQQLEDMAGFVPGIGTGVAEALGAAIALIEGNSPLEIALKAMIDLPPFVYLPPNIKDILRALIDAVVKLFEGDSVEDLALTTARKAILDQLPNETPDDIRAVVADFFDAMAQVILHGKALKDVGYQLALKAVKRAIGPAIDSIKATVDQAIQGAQKEVRDRIQNLLDELPPDIVNRIEAIAASLPEPAQSQLRMLKSKIEAVVSPFIDLLNNLASFRKFKAVAERGYVDTAGVRAKNSTLPAKSQQELVAIRDAALTSTDWRTIQDTQLMLLSYGATETANGSVVLLARTLDAHLREAFFANPQLMATGLLFYLLFLKTRILPSDKAYLMTMMSTLLKVQAQGLYPPNFQTGNCDPNSHCALLEDAIIQTKTQIDAVSGIIKPLPGNIVRVSGAFGIDWTKPTTGMSTTSKVLIGAVVAIGLGALALEAYARMHHMTFTQSAKHIWSGTKSKMHLTPHQKRIGVVAGGAVVAGGLTTLIAKQFVAPAATAVQPPIVVQTIATGPTGPRR